MAVYKRGYNRYQGSLTGRLTRLMVLPRFAWQRLLEQRLVIIVMVVSIFWPLACATFIYISNHLELLEGMGNGASKLLEINGTFFVIFMNFQATMAVILASIAGPSLIAPDLANGALPLYLSRPVTRTDYVVARMMVLVGLLSPVTWVPGLLLFVMQSGMAGWAWFSAHWSIAVGLIAGFMAWILLVALVAMACSAYVKWRIIAGALVLGFYFVLAGAATMINAVLRVDWGSVLNPAKAMDQIWRAMLGAEATSGPGAWACAVSMAVVAMLLIAVLERKLRPVEVIS